MWNWVITQLVQIDHIVGRTRLSFNDDSTNERKCCILEVKETGPKGTRECMMFLTQWI